MQEFGKKQDWKKIKNTKSRKSGKFLYQKKRKSKKVGTQKKQKFRKKKTGKI